MLVVIPPMPFGRLGAVLSALIVVACLIGLTMHKDFYAGRPRRGFFLYYTNLSNLIVLLYFSLIAPRLYARAALQPLIPHVEFAVMMSIMLTAVVFDRILMPPILARMRHQRRTREFYIVLVDNVFIHYLVPWLTFAYWLLCSPQKGALTPADAGLWTLVPLGYLFHVLLSARHGPCIPETDSPYPYPFLDVGRRGALSVLLTCARMLAACLSCGLLAVLILRAGFSVFGDGHALLLI